MFNSVEDICALFLFLLASYSMVYCVSVLPFFLSLIFHCLLQFGCVETPASRFFFFFFFVTVFLSLNVVIYLCPCMFVVLWTCLYAHSTLLLLPFSCMSCCLLCFFYGIGYVLLKRNSSSFFLKKFHSVILFMLLLCSVFV